MGLLDRRSERAFVLGTEDGPCLFLPAVAQSAGAKPRVRLEPADRNGLTRIAAVDLCRFMQRTRRSHLVEFASAEPRGGGLSARSSALRAEAVARRREAARRLLDGDPSARLALPIDQRVPSVAGSRRSGCFSPYRHSGHISAHEGFTAVRRLERWNRGRLAQTASGAPEDW